MRWWLFALSVTTLCGGSLACRRATHESPLDQVWGEQEHGRPSVVMHRSKPQKGEPQPAIDILARELQHNLVRLQSSEVEQPAYFLAYDLVAVEQLWIEAQDGELVRNDHDRDRTLDVDIRVGTPKLDNSHAIDGDYGPGNGLGSGLPVSIFDHELSLAQGLWLDTESQYLDAVAAWSKVQGDEQLRSKAGRVAHPDFSTERPQVHIEERVDIDLEALASRWIPRLKNASDVLADHQDVLESSVTLLAAVENRTFVNSEGSKIQGGRVRIRVIFHAKGRAEDGMELERFENIEVQSEHQLPNEGTVRDIASRLRDELVALRNAPIAEPFAGPVVLEGRAAGVFFHEIFGHRLEGHRQKDDLEGQTFTDMLGKRVLPSFLDVVDDPTVTAVGGIPLSGHYFVDDEAVLARRVVLVEKGKLRAFLLSRSPVLPLVHSNGHGRRQRGHQVVARQGNLIVSSRKRLSESELREALLDEARKQGKPYGLWLRDIQGGFTTTQRNEPQAFKVLPLLVYRVFTDRRPDELVRGVDIVGTPLSAFETIVATGNRPGVFNGLCGAESGWVPVSAVSPSLLLRNLEIERTAHDRDKPPLLPPPRNKPPGDATP